MVPGERVTLEISRLKIPGNNCSFSYVMRRTNNLLRIGNTGK
jgi:hypothetical protein